MNKNGSIIKYSLLLFLSSKAPTENPKTYTAKTAMQRKPIAIDAIPPAALLSYSFQYIK